MCRRLEVWVVVVMVVVVCDDGHAQYARPTYPTPHTPPHKEGGGGEEEGGGEGREEEEERAEVRTRRRGWR